MNYDEITKKLKEALVETNLSVQAYTRGSEKLLIMGVLQKLQDVFLEKMRDETETTQNDTKRQQV